MKRKYLVSAALVAAGVCANETPSPAALAADAQVGDCVILREGGGGRILKAPTYWLRGTVAAVNERRHFAALCPHAGRPPSSFTHDDWLRLAAAAPCVDKDGDAREVTVRRLSVRVEAWETPWSHQHGTAGLLFRGRFLEQTLTAGELVDIDAAWLRRCEAD